MYLNTPDVPKVWNNIHNFFSFKFSKRKRKHRSIINLWCLFVSGNFTIFAIFVRVITSQNFLEEHSHIFILQKNNPFKDTSSYIWLNLVISIIYYILKTIWQSPLKLFMVSMTFSHDIHWHTATDATMQISNLIMDIFSKFSHNN